MSKTTYSCVLLQAYKETTNEVIKLFTTFILVHNHRAQRQQDINKLCTPSLSVR